MLSGLGWIENQAQPGSPLYYQSWAGQLPNWTPDRRPLMVVQLSSAGWGENPNGNADWWWMADYDITDPANPIISADNNPKDIGRINTDYTENRNLILDGPNGVPDQFDCLIRHFDRWATNGVRRFVMHLPAGVYGGKFEGYGITYPPGHEGDPNFAIYHDGDPLYAMYGGTNQSMNQFTCMPSWKREYFLGVDSSGNPAPNAWTAFLAAHTPTNFNFSSDEDYFDKYSIEVYVGGGINTNNNDIGTQFIAQWDPQNGPVPIGTLKQSFNGLDEDGFRTYKPVWRKWHGNDTSPIPIDPRYAKQNNLKRVWFQLEPWIDRCGVKTIWLDAASENIPDSSRRWGTVELAHNPVLATKHARIGGETFPTIDLPNNGGEILDDCAVGNMPWFGNYEVASKPDAASPNGRTWKEWVPGTFDRNASEMHLLDGDGNKMGWNEWKQAREKGFVVGAYNAYNNYILVNGSYVEIKFARQAELLKRWYSLGKIRICDFDANNIVNQADFDLAAGSIVTAINSAAIGKPVWPIVFANGDINNDGVINMDDYNEFNMYWTGADANHTQATVVDFSAPSFRNSTRVRF